MAERPDRRSIVGAAAFVALAGLADLALAQERPTATATFAGGCFWCMETDFDKVPGVVSTTSGYTGGTVANPSYKAVSAGGSGHLEAVQIVYDPSVVTYQRLLDVFWRNIDPTDAGGQFCDRGESYRSAIFTANAAEAAAANASRAELAKSKRLGGPIATEIRPAGAFYPAETYHQDFAKRNPVKYSFYRYRCGRDARLKSIWGEEANWHGT